MPGAACAPEAVWLNQLKIGNLLIIGHSCRLLRVRQGSDLGNTEDPTAQPPCPSRAGLSLSWRAGPGRRPKVGVMKIEIWSDIACPFCYIGRRHLELALEELPFRDEVSVEWRSFQLDPAASSEGSQRAVEMLASKYGMSLEQARASQAQVSARAREVGLEMRDDGGVSTNTRDAHRLLHLAAEHGLQDELKGALFRAHFAEGVNVGDHAVLSGIATGVGLAGDEVSAVLNSDRFAHEVVSDQQEGQSLGVQGVPFFVLGRRYGLSGAQPVEVFREALEQAWQEQGAAGS